LSTTIKEKFKTIMEDAVIDAIKNTREKKVEIKSLNEFHQTLKEVYWKKKEKLDLIFYWILFNFTKMSGTKYPRTKPTIAYLAYL